MRIGARLLDQQHHHDKNGGSSVGYAKKMIKKKRTCYKRIIRRAPPPPIPLPLQELFDACGQIFKGSGTVPSPEDVLSLSRILDNMTPEDVGIGRNLDFLNRSTVKGTPRAKCTTIYKCKNFSLCIFFLPSSGVIPLHNHPGMTVFSKLLVGSMHVKSYDWAESIKSSIGSEPTNIVRLAKVQMDDIITAPCNSLVLYPTKGGNIHEFTAKTPCAILDVIGPPYSSEDGREESYYKDYPYSAFSKGEEDLSKEEAELSAWLEEIAVPETSQMDRIEYLGPQPQLMVRDDKSGRTSRMF